MRSSSLVRFDSIIADLPRILKGAKKHCYECGQQCHQCQALTQRICISCPNQFCIEHDTGCSSTYVSTLDCPHDLPNLTFLVLVCLVQHWREKGGIARLLKRNRVLARLMTTVARIQPGKMTKNKGC